MVPWGALGITISLVAFALFSHLYTSDISGGIPQAPTPLRGLMAFLTTSIYSVLILLSLLILSIFSGLYIVPLYAIMQHRSKDEYLSRIIAANNMVNALFMVSASIITIGLLALNVSVVHIFLALGIVNIPVFYFIRQVVKRRLHHA